MPKALLALEVSDWDDLKKKSGIARTPKLKALLGGSASVGPALASFRKALKDWNDEKGKVETMDTAWKYYSAAKKLKEALVKFEKIKDLTDPTVKEMKDSVAVWKGQAATLETDQLKYISTHKKALEEGGAGQMNSILNKTGTKGKFEK